MSTDEDRLLKLPEVCRIVGMSRTTVYERIKRETFPRPVDLGSGAVRWRESDVRGWMRALPIKGQAAA